MSMEITVMLTTDILKYVSSMKFDFRNAVLTMLDGDDVYFDKKIFLASSTQHHICQITIANLCGTAYDNISNDEMRIIEHKIFTDAIPARMKEVFGEGFISRIKLYDMDMKYSISNNPSTYPDIVFEIHIKFSFSVDLQEIPEDQEKFLLDFFSNEIDKNGENSSRALNILKALQYVETIPPNPYKKTKLNNYDEKPSLNDYKHSYDNINHFYKSVMEPKWWGPKWVDLEHI